MLFQMDYVEIKETADESIKLARQRHNLRLDFAKWRLPELMAVTPDRTDIDKWYKKYFCIYGPNVYVHMATWDEAKQMAGDIGVRAHELGCVPHAEVERKDTISVSIHFEKEIMLEFHILSSLASDSCKQIIVGLTDPIPPKPIYKYECEE